MKISAVTAFDYPGYQQYGKACLESLQKYWPYPVHVFYEEHKPDIADYKFVYHDRGLDQELQVFKGEWGASPIANGIMGNKINYRYEAVKFCNKVFCVTSPLRPDDLDWWVWIDADTVMTRSVEPELMEQTLKPDVVASYLGRKDWDHSECGFVAYNLRRAGDQFLAAFRQAYVTNALFNLEQWHDSYVFDVIRKEFERHGHKFHNISEGVPGLDVWPQTILGKYMIHYKGPKGKAEISEMKELEQRNIGTLSTPS